MKEIFVLTKFCIKEKLCSRKIKGKKMTVKGIGLKKKLEQKKWIKNIGQRFLGSNLVKKCGLLKCGLTKVLGKRNFGFNNYSTSKFLFYSMLKK